MHDKPAAIHDVTSHLTVQLEADAFLEMKILRHGPSQNEDHSRPSAHAPHHETRELGVLSDFDVAPVDAVVCLHLWTQRTCGNLVSGLSSLLPALLVSI